MKKKKILIPILLSTNVLFLILLVLAGTFLYIKDRRLNSLKQNLRQKEELIAVLKEKAVKIDEGSEPEIEDEASALEGIIKNFYYNYDEKDPGKVFEKIKSENEVLAFPVIYPAGASIIGDVKFDYVEYIKEDDSKDYDYETLQVDLVKNGLEMTLMQGYYSWGGVCKEEYVIEINLGELYVCINDDNTQLSWDNNANSDNSDFNTQFLLDNAYEKAELEEAFGNFKKVD